MMNPAILNKAEKAPVMVASDNLMTVKQYADKRGITTQAVYLAIKNAYSLPGVTDVIKVGEITLLVVE